MPSLLDLSDEIIQQIGHEVHGDTSIPLPSFRPHTENFKHRFDPTCADDYNRLRLVCRRIKSLLPLRNLHIGIDNMEKLDLWVVKAPTEVLRAVTRLKYDITRPYDGKPHHLWLTLTSFLSSLENLEEFYLSSPPFCGHLDDKEEDLIRRRRLRLRLPSYPIFPKVKSFANEVACSECSAFLQPLLIPAMPSLRHLKCTSIDTDLMTSEPIESLWEMRNKHELPVVEVETLYMAIDVYTMLPSEFRATLGDRLPKLKELVIMCRDVAEPAPLRPVFKISAETVKSSDEKWKWHLLDNWNEHMYRDPDDDADEDHDEDPKTVNDVLGLFDTCQHLESLDTTMTIELADFTRRPQYPTWTRGASPSSTSDTRGSGKTEMITDEYEYLFREAIKQVTTMFIARIPSLRTIRWWEDLARIGGRVGDYSGQKRTWLRWESRIEREESTGEDMIVVDPTPQRFTHDFYRNFDGARDPFAP
ncbi:hypothetical protein IAR55_003967 [Kwoniella newhampshirensis]|uniref:F-box domain-containing protein n=1 Tax=Kwoniella newhampshirensis TaxID=1651941 RepID=A0AAW0YY09_9TREE